MKLSKLFIFLIGITVILTILQLFGYAVLDSIIVIMVVDFLALGAMVQLERGNALIKNNPIDVETDIVPRLGKIDKIEQVSSEILEQVSNSGFSDFENKLKKQSDNIIYLLDKMARKTLELEERINKFGNGLLDSVSDISKRVGELEDDKPKEKETQSFSTGEILYEKEDNKV